MNKISSVSLFTVRREEEEEEIIKKSDFYDPVCVVNFEAIKGCSFSLTLFACMDV